MSKPVFQGPVRLMISEVFHGYMQPPDIGECIYCGDTEELTTEHIIPYGLGGQDVLVNASCSDCAQKTSRIELEVLRKQFMPLRANFDLPSRNDSVPENLPLTLLDEEDEKKVQIPTADHPTLVIFLHFPLPRALGGNQPKKGISIKGFDVVKVGGPELEEVAENHEAEEIRTRVEYAGTSFSQFLAKVAYGYGVEEYGLNELNESPLRPTILGQKDDAGRWVGSGRFDLNRADHGYLVKFMEEGDWLIASVRLFANIPSPEYVVVLNEGDDENKPEIPHGPIS